MQITPEDGVYLVSRTSCYADSEKPCDEAFEVEVLRVDARNVSSPEKLFNGADDWWARGTNHWVENGNIKRDLGLERRWAVHVDDIAGIWGFVSKYGDCVLSVDRNGFRNIEIYDSYRE